MQHGFYFDHGRCVKCHACEIACKAWNEVDVGPRWREVVKIESGTYPDVQAMNVSMACMHCGDAPCRTACPVSAITKRADDGIVVVDPNIVHWLRVLHLGLSVQCASTLGTGREDGEVQLLPDSGTGTPAPSAASVRGDLSHRCDPLGVDGRAREARRESAAARLNSMQGYPGLMVQAHQSFWTGGCRLTDRGPVGGHLQNFREGRVRLARVPIERGSIDVAQSSLAATIAKVASVIAL